MKKKYILLCTLAVSVSMFGQVSFQKTINNGELVNENVSFNAILPPIVASNSIPVTTIWEEDFSGGFPQGWSTYTSNTQGGLATCPWVWTIDGTWGYWNGNNGTSPSNGIASTTVSNGFLISDTDSANHYAYGQPSGTTYHYIESSFTTNAIDLSLHPAVSLEFEHLFRYNNLGNPSFTPPTVYVSSDSINWMPFLVNGGTSSNTQSSNPEYEIINITSIAGSQSTVYLRFGWVSRCYYWMIDDIRLIKTPDNLLVCQDEAIGGWWIGYQGPAGGIGQDYSQNPISQATASPYAFEGVLLNNGAATQEATLYVEVQNAGGSNVFSTTSNALTLAAGEQDTVAGTTMFTPTNTGLYNIEIWAEADSAGTGTVYTYTDTATKTTTVTDYVYGKDNGTNDGGYWRLNRAYPYAGGLEVSSNYDIYADATLYSVDAHISDWSMLGAEVYVALYEEDISGGDPILLAQSDNYAITQLDRGAWVNIPFLSAQSLTSTTKMYRIAIGANISTDTVGVDVSDPGGYYSAQGLFDKDAILTNSTSGPRWYTISDIPMLRMNFDPSTLIANTDFKQTMGFNVYPNPTNGVFAIELDANTKYDVTVYNVVGQKVLSTFTNGSITMVDLSSFDKGIYTIELKDENAIYIEKVIIE
ncbi:MAG: T9SS type A sorting domain-containing protein [Bacteroidota bacterium]|nr:T9SS type A sorting domain-containing protein [Bacteroidota bacterium]